MSITDHSLSVAVVAFRKIPVLQVEFHMSVAHLAASAAVQAVAPYKIKNDKGTLPVCNYFSCCLFSASLENLVFKIDSN